MMRGCSWTGAYPRLRGGTEARDALSGDEVGLSPPARGNRTGSACLDRRRGPIPACAGEPWAFRIGRCPDWAYPRLRGGTMSLTV